MSVEGILTILVDTARGMNHLPTRSPPIEHRDIHSRNILLLFGPLKAKLSCFTSAEIRPTLTTVFSDDIPLFGNVLKSSVPEVAVIKHQHAHVARKLSSNLNSLADACTNKDATLQISASIILDHLQEFLCEQGI